jgi:hypothetical protein
MDYTNMATEYPWQRLYEEALLETDRSKLEQRTKAATLAIQARVQELNRDHHGTAEERTAIHSALSGLTVLQREIQENFSTRG